MADAGAAVATSVEMKSPYEFRTEFVVKSAAQIWEGSGVAIGSDGYIVHASQSAALYTLGVAEQSVLGDGTKTCRVKQGVFRMGNAAGHLLTIANRLGLCYWSDDLNVGSDSSKLVAGIVIDVDAVGVWVLCGAVVPANAESGALLAANDLSDVSSAATSAHNLGLGTADSPTFTGLTLTGAQVGVTGAFTGIVTGLHKFAVKTTTYAVLNGTDSDALLQSLTDGQIFTLPASAAGNLGQEIVFQNTAADGAALIKIEPHSGDVINGQIGSVEFGSVASKGIWNTKATQKKGDWARLRSDGAGNWWVVGGQGVWASEA